MLPTRRLIIGEAKLEHGSLSAIAVISQKPCYRSRCALGRSSEELGRYQDSVSVVLPVVVMPR